MLATDERFCTRVGTVALVLVAVAIVFFTVAYDRIDWQHQIRVRVYFHDVGGLREGAPFIVAGRSIGRVESIALVRRGSPGPLAGERGLVVTVAIDADLARQVSVRAWPSFADASPDVFIGSRGVVSQRYLELAPIAEGAIPVREGDQLLGADPATLDSVLNRTLASMTLMRAFAAELRPEFEALRTQLACLRTHFATPEVAAMFVELGATAEELRRLRDRLGGPAGIAKARGVIGDARALFADARVTVDQLATRFALLRESGVRTRLDDRALELIAKVEPLIGQLRTVLAKADALLDRIQVVEARIARGEGSLLKLMFDPEFPEDMKDLGKVIKRQPWRFLDTAGAP